jgi:hypothetical protein
LAVQYRKFTKKWRRTRKETGNNGGKDGRKLYLPLIGESEPVRNESESTT